MILRCQKTATRARRGVAAVEMALVTMLFVVPVLIGVLELGRMIQVQQIVSNSAREGARLAGQGYTINATGEPTQITVRSGTPSVQSTVYQYLIAAGLTDLQPSDVTVTFAFTRPNSAGNMPTEPYLGEKNQPFTVTVEVNWSKVRWVNLGLVNPQKIQFTATWQMLVDEPFAVNGSLPTW